MMAIVAIDYAGAFTAAAEAVARGLKTPDRVFDELVRRKQIAEFEVKFYGFWRTPINNRDGDLVGYVVQWQVTPLPVVTCLLRLNAENCTLMPIIRRLADGEFHTVDQALAWFAESYAAFMEVDDGE